MKKINYYFVLLGLLAALQTVAQSAKDEQQIIARTQLLSQTIFGTKDSLILKDLFARTVSYGHSHGNLQTRQEAIAGIAKNRSVYKDTSLKDIQVIFGTKKTAIVRYLFDANENKTDGTVTALHFSMMLVWVKEDDDWKLFGRQAVSRDVK
ncbi:MAG: nuclear transport factor 2 family protein [Chitinophagaceae bacterium]